MSIGNSCSLWIVVREDHHHLSGLSVIVDLAYNGMYWHTGPGKSEAPLSLCNV